MTGTQRVTAEATFCRDGSSPNQDCRPGPPGTHSGAEAVHKAVVSDQVEKVAVTGAVDGMLMDHNDNLYLTALEENAIKRYRPDSRVLDTIVRDERIQWPDSLAISPDDYLYVTASQIHRMPRFTRGVDRRVLPYKYFKIWLAPM